MSRRILAVVCCAVLGSCTGGARPRLGGRFDVASQAPKPAPASSTVALPAERPPAKLFAGSQSVDGVLSRYCTGKDECAQVPPQAPPAVSAPPGSAVVFTVSAQPSQARVEVRSPAGALVATRPLAPSPAMYWAVSPASGRYMLELFATYSDTDVAWRFGLNVTGG